MKLSTSDVNRLSLVYELCMSVNSICQNIGNVDNYLWFNFSVSTRMNEYFNKLIDFR